MSSQTPRSTIVGVATGVPDGGLAVLRISGPEARAIAAACVRGPLPAPRELRRRRVGPGEDAEGSTPSTAVGEDALVAVMPGPGSFTGEDVVELHVHGGQRNVDQIVGWLMRAGAVAAGPGDFSRRAFELGRLTLDQAEGIAAVIGAQTDMALVHARKLVAGELRDGVERLRAELMSVRLDVEGAIGFPEDVDDAEVERWSQRAGAIGGVLEDWLGRFEAGQRARSRARVVLAGRPNAGKSALFNALLGRRRAIVADVPGTTRDFIEAELDLGPYGATLVDTAGIRDAVGAVEAAGVALSRAEVEGADLVVWVCAADDEGSRLVAAEPAAVTVIEVESKRDLGCRRPAWTGVSIHDAASVDALRDAIRSAVWGSGPQPWIGLARHRARAREARAAVREAEELLRGGADRLELAALPLMIAWSRLGEIVGAHALGVVGDEVLGEIFSRFCIGK